MSARGRSTSPHPLRDEDVEMDATSNHEKSDIGNSNGVEKSDSKVVVVTNLTRNVVHEHLQTIFGFYGEIVKLDLPLYGKCTSLTPTLLHLGVLHYFMQTFISELNIAIPLFQLVKTGAKQH